MTPVIIIGGGLAGLYAAHLLHKQGVGFRLLEARNRLGGRILTTKGFDLGPSWFWPEMHTAMAAVVAGLGLAAFAQHETGDVLVERRTNRSPERFEGYRQEPRSMRLVGGTTALVQTLAAGLPAESIQLGTQVTRLALGKAGVTLSCRHADGQEETLLAEQVIAALPPRLLQASITFAPAVQPAMQQLWRDTATWMAPHAKFFALYDRPFWRDAGLSGMAQSMVGPLGEIHDATTAEGSAALFGFVGVEADRRDAVGGDLLTRACVEQLARLFGADAARPRATLLQDWAAEHLTATAADRSGGAHPLPQLRPWVTGAWQQRLALAGSETSPMAPGYLAGARDAAARAVAWLTRTDQE
jgi:monoamine oxidase